ncbi:MAG: hypothetical protein V1827_02925 [Candidatus Micrarchaeota archaeon]
MSKTIYEYSEFGHSTSLGVIGVRVQTTLDLAKDVARLVWKQGVQVSPGNLRFVGMVSDNTDDVSHVITLSPKRALSKPGMKEMTIKLRGDLSRADKDGEFQTPPKSMRGSGPKSAVGVSATGNVVGPLGGRRYP